MKFSGLIMLVNRDSIPSVIQDELRRLRPDNIFVLGGMSAVSASVEKQLAEYLR